VPENASALCNGTDSQTDQVTAAQPTIDSKVEEGSISHLARQLQTDTDCPDFFGFSGAFCLTKRPLLHGTETFGATRWESMRFSFKEGNPNFFQREAFADPLRSFTQIR